MRPRLLLTIGSKRPDRWRAAAPLVRGAEQLVGVPGARIEACTARERTGSGARACRMCGEQLIAEVAEDAVLGQHSREQPHRPLVNHHERVFREHVRSQSV
jgi:hypothetical protein